MFGGKAVIDAISSSMALPVCQTTDNKLLLPDQFKLHLPDLIQVNLKNLIIF
jgi:hypothetical protein